MASRTKRSPAKKAGTKKEPPTEAQVQSAVKWLQSHSTRRTRDGMARYAIPADKAFGVTVADIRVLAKSLGRNHELALALWDTGWYEARMLTAFVAEPGKVTPAQMDRWCRDFDSWAICDTLCFHLFDRTPHAWDKVEQWSTRQKEFEKRAAFALIASLAGHDKTAPDRLFADTLPVIERGASDERNFVKKAVSWALRGVGRRSMALHEPAVKLARRLAESPQKGARWVGKDVLRELTNPAVIKRMSERRRSESN